MSSSHSRHQATALTSLAAAGLFLAGCSISRQELLYDFAQNQAGAVQREDTLYIDFGTPAARPYLVRAWSDDEMDNVGRTFVWATDPRAAILFESTAPQDIELVLNCRPVDAREQSQTLSIDINGQTAGTAIELKKEFGEYRFFLPARLQRTGRNILGMTFAYAVRPEVDAAAPQRREERKLAACVDSMLFAPYNLLERELKMGRAEVPAYVKELEADGSRTIVQRASQERAFALRIPEKARLAFRCGLAPEDWKLVEGAGFSVTLQVDGQKPHVLFSQYCDPKRRRSHQTLFKEDINLEQWAGQLARITFSVRPGYERVTYPTYGVWIDPKIYRRHYAWEAQQATAATAVAESTAQREIRSKLNKYSVAVILLDAASASHFGCYGYHLPTTPNIDRIAAEGVQFMNAYTQAVYTRASTGSLMTGQYPDLHRVLFARDRLPESAFTLAEMFSAAGVRTASFVGNPHAGENAGYKQGFGEMVEMYKIPGYRNLAGDFEPHLYPWLQKSRDTRSFAYIHFREPHFISDPPREFLARFATGYKGKINPQSDLNSVNVGRIQMDDGALDRIRSVYDATLNYADSVVGAIVAEMKRTGVWDKTIVIILADHGEALWEHGYFGHNVHVYEDMAHIPLIIHFPPDSGVAQPRKINGLAQTIDLFATFAEVLDSAEGRKHAAGRSLIPVLAGEPDPEGEFVFTRSLWGRATYGVRHERWEYVYRAKTDEEELYDLWTDRLEEHNLAAERPVLASYLRSHMLGWMHEQAALAAQAAAPSAATFDEETRKSLLALGYVNAGDADQEGGN